MSQGPGAGAVPASILLGCAMIAVAVYFGLRARSVARDEAVLAPRAEMGQGPARPEVVGVGPAIAVASVPPVAASTPPASVAPAPGARRSADDDLRAALEAKRALFVEKCWGPAIRSNPLPDHSTYRFDVVFDTAGNQVGQGISEIDSTSRPDVARCLRSQHIAFSIPGRGVVADCTVKMTLP